MAKRNRQQIFKIQVPVAGAPLALIYNKDRSICFQLPLNEEARKELNRFFKKDEYKIYVEGRLKGPAMDAGFEILKRMPEQAW
ncbi:hypothetical protein DLP3_116 [Stenotrophomonas phage vB_SmaS_DLP_3]|nr:hypothetical protein DLP3_116 [Stenotrophomonas phage vB_SmaS_DLP_3]